MLVFRCVCLLLHGDELKINGSARIFPGVYVKNDINAALGNLDVPFKGTVLGILRGVQVQFMNKNL